MAEYLTQLPSLEVLEDRLHKAVIRAKEIIALCESLFDVDNQEKNSGA